MWGKFATHGQDIWSAPNNTERIFPAVVLCVSSFAQDSH